MIKGVLKSIVIIVAYPVSVSFLNYHFQKISKSAKEQGRRKASFTVSVQTRRVKCYIKENTVGEIFLTLYFFIEVTFFTHTAIL